LKKLLSVLLILNLCLFICPFLAYADVGPKPTLEVIAQNMPDTTCYLDLLVNDPPEGVHQNITEVEKYDPQLLEKLKKYKIDGWRPAMVTGTMPPLFGDIICDIKNGQCTLNFSYLGVPDKFKIIVVSSDGKTTVSNVIERKAFNSTVRFDYETGRASERSPLWAYLFQFIFTCSVTIVIEGVVLLLFGFNLKSNWKPFITINVITQVLLTLVVFSTMYKLGTLLAVLLYLPFEMIILVMEASLFAKYLKQHSKARRVFFAVTANIASFIFGIMVMLHPMWW